MVIKLYISGISGNKEVKKKQQRVQMILDSKQINYEAIDITEPGKEKDKEFMQQNGKVRESLGKYPLPPQIFNDEDFCGDYEDFDLANEVDELEKFLHIETSSNENDAKNETDSKSISGSLSQASVSLYNPYEYHTFKIKYDGVNGLKEQIINTNELSGENDKDEEVTKSEVNGEYEAVPGLEPCSENITEIPAEESVAPEKEESSLEENRTVKDDGEKETEENAEEKEVGEKKGEVEEKAGGKEEEKEDVDTHEEEKSKNLTEEKAPPAEDNKADEEEEEDEEDKKEAESEKEETSDNESEKSQEN